VPAVRSNPDGLPREGSWLVKPRRSAGGRNVRPLLTEVPRSSRGCYFQERIEGPSYSALVIAERDGARLIGVTQQLLGATDEPFAYRGNIGPCPIAPALAAKLARLGQVLASAFGLVGWFGVDYVLCAGEPWPVEVNPRYTASVEIYELAAGRSLLHEHRRACEGQSKSAQAPLWPSSARQPVIAKLIVYAPRALVVPDFAFGEHRALDPFALQPLADVPWPGTRFAPGDPVMTLFASGQDMADCRSRLDELEQEWVWRLERTDSSRSSDAGMKPNQSPEQAADVHGN
jgi:uncharacterized protein